MLQNVFYRKLGPQNALFRYSSFKCLFILQGEGGERERMCTCEGGGRGRGRDCPADSPLSVELDTGLHPTTREIMT